MKKIEERKLLVKGDKTDNFIEMDPKKHEEIMKREIQKDYRKSTTEAFNNVTKDDKKIAIKLEIDDRCFKTSPVEAYVTVKDHKPNWQNALPARLINGTKQNLGRASKKILEKIVSKLKYQTKLNQWKNTAAMLQWFTRIEIEERNTFIQWDIVDFYGSIKEELLIKALDWASTMVPITPDQRELFLHVRKSFLFYKKEAWVKKENENFNVAMGSFDSAECSDLCGLYLLHLLKQANLNINVGLYRDDALAVTKLRPQQYEKARQKIVKLFKDNGLKITITAGITQCDFLDVSLDLGTMLYKPYHKENKIPKYVNVGSNHPRSIIKNIPLGVQERLSMTSSNEEIFKNNREFIT